MCGRFTLRRPDKVRIEGVSAGDFAGAGARYNVAPSQDILGVIQTNEERHALRFQWGLVPSWSREPMGFINARAETVAEKPSFWESFKRRRCLIPADGFYEWRREGRAKQPFYFQMKDEGVFAFAGLWDTLGKDGDPVVSCAIITTTPNDLVGTVHDRMPVILSPSDFGTWLSGEADPNELRELLAPFPAEYMQGYPVGQGVNNPGADGPHLVTRG
ncbi:MAG: SOS response-associated peptidase [Pyrinomonadaceae bacterium]